MKTAERWVDCKTVRFFAYSSTGEQSNKRSGTRLKTVSETGDSYATLYHFFTDFKEKTRLFCSLSAGVLLEIIFSSITSITASLVTEQHLQLWGCSQVVPEH